MHTTPSTSKGRMRRLGYKVSGRNKKKIGKEKDQRKTKKKKKSV